MEEINTRGVLPVKVRKTCWTVKNTTWEKSSYIMTERTSVISSVTSWPRMTGSRLTVIQSRHEGQPAIRAAISHNWCLPSYRRFLMDRRMSSLQHPLATGNSSSVTRLVKLLPTPKTLTASRNGKFYYR